MQLGIPLPFASIDNRRDIVALPVICDLINACLDSARADHQTFLVADGQARSTADIVHLLARIHHIKARLFAVPAPLLHMLSHIPGLTATGPRLLDDLEVDITHTIDQLGWRPKVPDPATMGPGYQ